MSPNREEISALSATHQHPLDVKLQYINAHRTMPIMLVVMSREMLNHTTKKIFTRA